MRKALCAGTVLVLFSLLFSCSSQWAFYQENLFDGKRLYDQGRYGDARERFQQAARSARDPAASAWAAMASYKIDDLTAAEQYIRQAEKLDSQAYFCLRISGYKALILLKENKRQEGLEALRAYVSLYDGLVPLMSVQDVRKMAETGDIALPVLERLIDEQITIYEDEVEQLHRSGTGFLGNKNFSDSP
jgi:tetratricopeptide (TPR) repeat protein